MLTIFHAIATRLKRDEEGATAVEYGLIVALIAVVIIAAVALVGDNLGLVFNDVAGELGEAVDAGGDGA